MIFFYKKNGEILSENFNDTHKINFSDVEISAAQDALNIALSEISDIDGQDHSSEIDAIISEHKLPDFKEISGDALKNYIVDNNLTSFDVNNTDYFIWETSLPLYYDVDFLNKTLIILPAPTPDYTEKIKIECGRRINDAISANTRENMAAEIGRLQFEKPTGWEARMSLIMLVLNWVRAMISASRTLVIAQDAAYENDGKWPVLAPETQSIIDEL